MGPVQAIKTCLAKSFQYSGRANRSEYWWFLPIGLATPAAAVNIASSYNPDMSNFALAGIALLALSPLMAVTKRRLNDCGEPSTWFETPLMALIFFLFAVLCEIALNSWAVRLWNAGADGPDGFAVMVLWITGNLVLIPMALHQFFLGLITGSALFSQMTASSAPNSKTHGPNPLEAPK